MPYRSQTKKNTTIASLKIRQILLYATLLLGLVTMISHPPAVQAADGVPFPAVTGPIPATDASHPFWDRMEPPREAALRAGYVEEEFFIKGTVNVYEWNTDGSAVPVVRTLSAPYTTRIIVRRPAKQITGKQVKERFLLSKDARKITDEAAKADVP